MDEKIQKAFRLLSSTNPAERANAADALVSLVTREGVTMSELTVVHSKELHGQLYEHQRRIQADLEKARQSLAFLLDRANEDAKLSDAVKWMERRQAKVDRWPALRELAMRKLFRGSWPEDRSVFKMIGSAVGVTPEEVRGWREGVREIPEAALQALRDAAPGRRPKPVAKRVVAKPLAVAFGGALLPEKEYLVLRTLLDADGAGLHLMKIADRSELKAKTVTSRLSYLKRSGLAEQTGKSGYWRATPKAVEIACEARDLQVA